MPNRTAKRDAAKNSEQGERTSRIQAMEGEDHQNTELLGRNRLMAPFSTRRERKDDGHCMSLDLGHE